VRTAAAFAALPLLVAVVLTVSACSGPESAHAQAVGDTGQAKGRGSERGLVISEVMSSNRSSLTLPDGSTPDWIELCNPTSKTIDLTGYMLSDNARKPNKHVFAGGAIESGAYLLVYADGRKPTASAATAATDAASTGGPGDTDVIELPFRVSSAGERIVLATPNGTVADEWAVPALPSDVSYGRPGGSGTAGTVKVYFDRPTPGRPNGVDGKPTAAAAMGPAITSLVINEYCTRSISLRTETGGLAGWVELYNTGSEPLDLSGHFLSQDPAKPREWRFRGVSLAAQAYLVLVFTGKTDPTTANAPPLPDGYLRVDLEPPARVGRLLISDAAGRTVATAAVEPLPADVSKGRLPDNPDAWGYFSSPTPGAANTTAPTPLSVGGEPSQH
jgi:hypothetical protein